MNTNKSASLRTVSRVPDKSSSSRQAEPPKTRPACINVNSDEEDIPLALTRPRRKKKPAQTSKSAKPAAPGKSKAGRKRGPYNKPAKVFSGKPVSKNDMQAKRQIIREIETHWGEGFIKRYIPKCHRPLAKPRNGKRSIYRTYESDPDNWLPSVLKAMLMVASQTNDVAAFHKAIDDVVRHRIKNTGNRKPQLVTTDFDVIEDMIIRGWSCEDSFKIRYKHLLLQQTGGLHVTEEEVNAIMDPDKGHQDTSDDDLEERPRKTRRYKRREDIGEVHVNDGSDNAADEEEPVWVQRHPYHPPKLLIQPNSSKKSAKVKQEKAKKPPRSPTIIDEDDEEDEQSPEQPPQQPHFGAYGPPPGYPNYPPHHAYGYPPYGYPPPHFGYPPYNPYSPHPGYGPPAPPRDPRFRGGRHSDMHAYPPDFYGQMTPSPGISRNSRGGTSFAPYEHGEQGYSPYGHPWQPQREPYIKQEPGMDRYPTKMLENIPDPDQHIQSIEEEEVDVGYLDEKDRLELEAAEAEARLAKLRANAAKATRAAKAARANDTPRSYR